MKYRPPLGLLKPSDWCCTVRIDFNVARDSRWLTRSASRPLPPALSRCPLTNLVGEDNQRRRTPAVLRPWTLAGPTDAAGALNRTVCICKTRTAVRARCPLRSRRRGGHADEPMPSMAPGSSSPGGGLTLTATIKPGCEAASPPFLRYSSPLDAVPRRGCSPRLEVLSSRRPPAAGREAFGADERRLASYDKRRTRRLEPGRSRWQPHDADASRRA